MRPSVRPSPIAGTWYAGSARRLAAEVDGQLHAARVPRLEGTIVGVIAPHAGLRYSGAVAACAFAALRGLAPELVALVGPMHAPGPASLLGTAHDAWATPLGEVPVDTGAVRRLDEALRSAGGPGLTLVREDEEHALEIELPFLQRVLTRPFAIVPVMVRTLRAEVLQALGQALAGTLEGRAALLVASTDLSHFHPQGEAVALDSEMLRRVEAFDPRAVLRAEEEGVGLACGAGALAAVLWAAQGLGADRVRVLRHATSGDVTGDLREVVGYAAAVITRGGTMPAC